VKPIEPVVRPKGLGLGASKPKQEKKVEGNKDEEELDLKRGAFILIESGHKKGQYAEVEGLDEDNGRVFVKMAIGNNATSVSENIIKLVTKKEFKDNGKVVNLDKYEEYKKTQDEKKNREKIRSHSRSPEKNGRYKDSEKYSRRSRSNSRDDYSPEIKKSKYDGRCEKKKERTWVMPQLKVRCIDSKLKNGKYYKSKLAVVDVVTNESCDCRTEEGRLVEDVRTDKLETVIPKGDGAVVMVVRGRDRGQIGEILTRDRGKCMATVKLLQGQEIVKLDYDNVCEFMGEVMDD